MPDDFAITTEDAPEPGPGQFLVRTTLLSVDPAMRGWMDDAPSYLPPIALGDVIRAAGVGEVVASNHPRYPIGTQVQGNLGFQELALSDGRDTVRINPELGSPSMYLGVLGLTGLTAYFGLLDHGRPRAGDTVLISAAAGAVGTIAAQIALIGGARVVGIAGGPDKCRYLTEDLGLHAAIDYRQEGIRRAIRAACPDGIDVYFDNVGGEILDAALANLAMHARIVVCGAIAQYNAESRPSGPANYLALLVRRASMSGFLVFDHASEYAVARTRLAGWVKEGRITAPETVVTGRVTDFLPTFLRLFSGDNLGKLVLDVSS